MVSPEFGSGFGSVDEQPLCPPRPPWGRGWGGGAPRGGQHAVSPEGGGALRAAAGGVPAPPSRPRSLPQLRLRPPRPRPGPPPPPRGGGEAVCLIGGVVTGPIVPRSGGSIPRIDGPSPWGVSFPPIGCPLPPALGQRATSSQFSARPGLQENHPFRPMGVGALRQAARSVRSCVLQS